MGKDAISNKKKDDLPPKSNSNVDASPIIFIIAILSLVVIGLFLFKDRIFKKKNQNLSDTKQEEPTKEPDAEPETITGQEAIDINEKFEVQNA
jgi:hypothetical protein